MGKRDRRGVGEDLGPTSGEDGCDAYRSDGRGQLHLVDAGRDVGDDGVCCLRDGELTRSGGEEEDPEHVRCLWREDDFAQVNMLRFVTVTRRSRRTQAVFDGSPHHGSGAQSAAPCGLAHIQILSATMVG